MASDPLTKLRFSTVEPGELDTDAVMRVYMTSGLAERRPLSEPGRLRRMIDGSNLIAAAYDEDVLIGIARSISDFSYATYLSDLAVDAAYQRGGVGRELIRLTAEAAPQATIILLAAPAAAEYYPRIGFTQHMSAWTLSPEAG